LPLPGGRDAPWRVTGPASTAGCSCRRAPQRFEPDPAGTALGRLELVRSLQDPELASPLAPMPGRAQRRSHSSGGSGGGGLASCFRGAVSSVSRLEELGGPHSGPVRAILVHGSRVYTSGAGGRGAAAAPPALMVWDAGSGQLLWSVTKKSTQWMR
jgi:hypothetical protein